jgi:hypothetical protein
MSWIVGSTSSSDATCTEIELTISAACAVRAGSKRVETVVSGMNAWSSRF